MRKKIVIALALLVFVAVAGSLILFTQRAFRTVAGDSSNGMIPEIEIPGCSWDGVDPVVPAQFESSPTDFLAFETGYHRMAICQDSMVDVVILSYGSVAQAQAALQAAKEQKPSKGDVIASFDNPYGDTIDVWKTQSSEGGVLYIVLWRQDNRLKFITEETVPHLPQQPALERLQKLVDSLSKDDFH